MPRRTLLAILACLFTAPALAQQPSPPTASASKPPGPTEPHELQSFLDGFFTTQMPNHHVPGAAVAVVKGGRLLSAAGFGFADLAQRKPVVADRTLFDVQSVAKLFTVTAVMQAVERGQLGLDDDVHTYLKRFTLGQDFPEPIRLAHLLTHTSGLEHRGIGITARHEAGVLPLADYLAHSLPTRARPPGRFFHYSDHGICLAAHVLEAASGVPFSRFAEENLFRPLGMSRTRFLTLPPDLVSDLAVGYSYEHGHHQPIRHDYYNIWPSSSLMTTAADVSRFMIAHLENGRYGDVRILADATATQMHRRQFSHHPKLSGLGYDFFEHFENGHRAIRHTGAGSGFTSELLLLPDQDLGYFLAINLADPALLHLFRSSFFNRYLPRQAKAAHAEPLPHSPANLRRLAGWYWFNEYDRRTIEKVGSLLTGYVRVSANSDQTLSVDGQPYVEVEPLLFQHLENDPPRYALFAEDATLSVAYLVLNDYTVYERVPLYASLLFQLALLAVVIPVFLSACVGWPLAYAIRRRHGPVSQPPWFATLARWWAGAATALNLAVLLAFALVLSLSALPSVQAEFQLGVPPLLLATLACASLVALSSLPVPVLALVAWLKRYWSLAARLHFSVVAAALVAFAWFLNFWNLLGFRY